MNFIPGCCRHFFNWQAPWLLLLTNLNNEERATIEQQARKRASDVARNYHLYPTIVNEKKIKAALVEAMLRSHHPPQREEEQIMSTWYLEPQSTSRE